jgi:crossover junction endodeoxyribonuclease RuvC
MTTYLGNDVGYRSSGFAIVSAEKEKLQLLYAENFYTDKKDTLPKNLADIADHFKKIVKEYKPTVYIYENPVLKGDVGAKLNQSIGVTRYLANKYQLEEFSYMPTEIKKAVAHFGGSDKQGVIEAVEKVFPERKFELKENHCADACAAILCHFYKTSLYSVL